MKNIFVFLFAALLVFGCSSSNDSEGNLITVAVPLAPSNLTGTIANNLVTLTWTDNSTNETGFKIERMTGTGNWSVNGSVATNILTYTDASVTAGTTYVFRVYSFNSAGNSLNYSSLYTITIPSMVAQTVTIGSQIWTTKNLEVTTYRDGTLIPQVSDPTAWRNLTTGAWCYYNNDTANGTTYGKLYNWYAVAGIFNAASLSDVTLRKKLAPTGYHVSTDAEWTTLTTSLGGETVAGGKMKETGTTHWTNPNTAATNSSGFTALPGGARGDGAAGGDSDIGAYGFWWSSSEVGVTNAWSRDIGNYGGAAFRSYPKKHYGFSVRCLKD